MKNWNVCFRSVIVLWVLISPEISAQTRQELEKERNENQAKLKMSMELLNDTREERKVNINQLSILQRGINYREALIEGYRKEVDLLDMEIESINRRIEDNIKTLEEVKERYSAVIKAAYKYREENYVLMYLLSSEDINQGYQRIRYLRYINDARKKLYLEIEQLNDSLLLRQEELKERKEEKNNLLTNLQTENRKLVNDRQKTNNLVSQLQKKEKKLLDEIRRREEVENRIAREIRSLIEEEARKAARENRANLLTPAERIISENFAKNKGGLPWPTETGIVTGSFGERRHPVLKEVTIKSNGIDISTKEGSEVRAVFKGEVTKVVAILGANYTVIIKHGNFRSVYQNLVDVRVKAGDQVETKDIIGKVYTDDNRETQIHFEIWNEMEIQNPEIWLSR